MRPRPDQVSFVFGSRYFAFTFPLRRFPEDPPLLAARISSERLDHGIHSKLFWHLLNLPRLSTVAHSPYEIGQVIVNPNRYCLRKIQLLQHWQNKNAVARAVRRRDELSESAWLAFAGRSPKSHTLSRNGTSTGDFFCLARPLWTSYRDLSWGFCPCNIRQLDIMWSPDQLLSCARLGVGNGCGAKR
jgi:hypothetical protein